MRVIMVLLVTAALQLVTLAPSRAASPPGEPLPTDPALVTGRLANGLKYIIRQNRNPEGRVGIWLHVSSGSFKKTEPQGGPAPSPEQMASNGPANFPPGSGVPFSQSFGMSLGSDQNAS